LRRLLPVGVPARELVGESLLAPGQVGGPLLQAVTLLGHELLLTAQLLGAHDQGLLVHVVLTQKRLAFLLDARELVLRVLLQSLPFAPEPLVGGAEVRRAVDHRRFGLRLAPLIRPSVRRDRGGTWLRGESAFAAQAGEDAVERLGPARKRAIWIR